MEEVLFQIMARSDGLKLNALITNLFLKNIQHFSSEDVNCWTGVDHLWIIVMFLSVVLTLILTAPIGDKPNKLFYIFDGLRASQFSANFHFLDELFLLDTVPIIF